MTEHDPYQRARHAITEATASWAGGLSLAEIRSSFEDFLVRAGGPKPAGVTTKPIQIGNMHACWFVPDHANSGPCLLYCHGGGYQIGSVRSHASLMARLAKATGLRVLGFDYRLAPEHRAPAATQDALAAYQWLLQVGDLPLAIVGDSAGGGLALATAIAARDQGLALPNGLVLLSAWLDLGLSGDSYRRLEDLDIFSKPGQLRAMARTYLGRGADPVDPKASPVFDTLDGLPPMLVHAGGYDITLDDSRLLATRAQAAQVPVTLTVFEGMYHHFQIFADLPETAQSLAGIAGFLQRLASDQT
ncbi:MAG: alpha/beta hydrolase [Rhizobiales bacterium]|nr:alpha/beta hydrolase [Hyphomicrobiales bacterium]